MYELDLEHNLCTYPSFDHWTSLIKIQHSLGGVKEKTIMTEIPEEIERNVYREGDNRSKDGTDFKKKDISIDGYPPN